MFSGNALCYMCGQIVKDRKAKACPACGASSIHFGYSGILAMAKLVRGMGFIPAITEKIYELYFTWKYEVETSGVLTRADANQEQSERFAKFGVYYSPTHFTTLSRVFHLLPIDPSQSTLLDYGSGKGRVIMYALLNNYRRVIGVEFSKELCELSKRNLKKLEKVRKTEYNYEIKNIDASYYSISEDVNVIFMFNPFSGPVFDSVMNEVSSFAKGKEVYLVYLNIKEKVPDNFVPFRILSPKSVIFKVGNGLGSKS